MAGARGVIELRPESVAQLRALSAEPILLKQGEDGVRVQIEHRPMMPLMAFLGKDVSSALQETAGEVTERYGVKWVVLVSVRRGRTRDGAAARLSAPRRTAGARTVYRAVHW